MTITAFQILFAFWYNTFHGEELEAMWFYLDLHCLEAEIQLIFRNRLGKCLLHIG